MLRTYGKSIVATLVAVLVVVSSAITDGRITTAEWVQIAIAACSAVAVYVAPNLPRYPAIKTAMAALLAVLNASVTTIGHLTPAGLVNLVVAALGVLVVHAAPAQVQQPTPPVEPQHSAP